MFQQNKINNANRSSSMAKDSKTGKKKLFSSGVNFSDAQKEKLIKLLNQHLADTLDLYNDTKQAHWNVKGETFYMLHELFDEIADEIENFVDDIAERITAMGGYAEGTTRMAAERSKIPEYPVNAVSGKQHVEALVERYTYYANEVREAIDTFGDLKDMDSADLFTEISRYADKALWFLEAHLQK